MKSPLFPLVVVSVLGLTACASSAAGEPTETPTASPSSSNAIVTPGPIEPDTTLIIKATATHKNGAQLALELRVHASTPWSDVAAQTIPAAFEQDCGYTSKKLADEKWGFTRANLTAIPTADSTATWPSDSQISLSPSGKSVPSVGRGTLSSNGPCGDVKTFTMAGSGALAIGIAGDADESAPKPLTGWTQEVFGFLVGKSSHATLTECTIQLTDRGATDTGTIMWPRHIDGTSCLFGDSSN
ncbi:MAG TPA: hypothetical protein VNT53_03120 [Pseudolysinimonas sp.]|nr:hypothetical protein [Pseudolysinimonas sp.]